MVKNKKEVSQFSFQKKEWIIISVCVICLIALLAVTLLFEPVLPTMEQAKPVRDVLTALRLENIDENTVVLVEFADFECPFCAQSQKTLESVLARNPDVVFARRQFPLSSIHPNAYNAAVVAECVQNHEFEQYMYKNQNQLAQLSNLANNFELNISRCLIDPQAISRVSYDIAAANQFGVRGTPTYVLLNTANASNYKLLEGTRSVSEFESMIAIVRDQ